MKVSSDITVEARDLESTDLLTTSATIAQNGNITTQGTITSTGDLTAPNIYTKTEVNKLRSQKHPLLSSSSSSDLAIGELITRT